MMLMEQAQVEFNVGLRGVSARASYINIANSNVAIEHLMGWTPMRRNESLLLESQGSVLSLKSTVGSAVAD